MTDAADAFDFEPSKDPPDDLENPGVRQWVAGEGGIPGPEPLLDTLDAAPVVLVLESAQGVAVVRQKERGYRRASFLRNERQAHLISDWENRGLPETRLAVGSVDRRAVADWIREVAGRAPSRHGLAAAGLVPEPRAAPAFDVAGAYGRVEG